ncbi:MAG: hypothetical protein QOH98_717, partial [Methylobacteriaceae bacterium]|nr:hypothetical protein [Methylobacteriaceae bacterium]
MADPLRKSKQDAEVATLAAGPAPKPILVPSLVADMSDAVARRRRRIAKIAGGA